MKTHVRNLLLPCILATMGLWPAAAWAEPAQAIRWGGIADPCGSARSNVLHAPDDRVSVVDPPLTVSDFTPAIRYAGLAGRLGVDKGLVDAAEILALEGNGGSPAPAGGYESGEFTVSDGATTLTIRWNGVDGTYTTTPFEPTVIVSTGSVTQDQYRRAFGICSPLVSTVYSYLLIDLGDSPLDISSPSLSIRMVNVLGNPGDQGTPDPDAVGILSGPCQ